MNFDLKFIIILILIAIIAFQNCNTNKDGVEQVKVNGTTYNKIKYTVDTFETMKTKTFYKKGDDMFYEKTIVDTEYMNNPVDTMLILKDYFTKKIYKDTLSLPDSLGLVFVYDTITQNTISGRYWIANVKQRTINETTFLAEQNKNEFYYGFNLSGNKINNLNSVGTGFLLKNKSNNIFLLNVGLTNTGVNMQPYVGGGYYWKIGKK